MKHDIEPTCLRGFSFNSDPPRASSFCFNAVKKFRVVDWLVFELFFHFTSEREEEREREREWSGGVCFCLFANLTLVSGSHVITVDALDWINRN